MSSSIISNRGGTLTSNGYDTQGSQDVTAGATLSVLSISEMQLKEVTATAGSATVSTTPFGTDPSKFQDGKIIGIVNTHATNTVTLGVNDIQYGFVASDPIVLAEGEYYQVMYNATLERFVPLSAPSGINFLSIASDILPDVGGTRVVGSAIKPWSEVNATTVKGATVTAQTLNMVSGTMSTPFGTRLELSTIATVNTSSLDITVITGGVTGIGGDSGDLKLRSGNSSATGGNSGNILLLTGTATATRGKIQLSDDSIGTIGEVWTSIDAFGSGEWKAAPVAGAGTPIPVGVENILSSDATANADIADLTFTGLTIGAKYSLKGQISLDSEQGFINGVQFMGGSSLTGTTHGRVELVNETIGEFTTVTYGVSLEFTADSTTLYTNKDTADSTVFGDGTKGSTFLQLREIPQFTGGGGGGSGGINYMTDDNKDAEVSVGDWLTYADAAGLNPVDGTAGAATLTFARNLTTPLRETGDFKLVKDAANRQGEGASCPFTIDLADKGKKLTISFDYDTSDAGYADDDIRISVYDITNANLIRINGEDLKGGKGTHYAQFQTASDSVSYRLIVHQSSTNATGYSLYFDNFSVGPTNISKGVTVTGWVAFTPTGSFTTNSTYTGFYRRVGDTMEVDVNISFAGAPNSTTLTVDNPLGVVIDSAKSTNTNVRNNFGYGRVYDNIGNTYHIDVGGNTTTEVAIKWHNSGILTNLSEASPITLGASDSINVKYSFPVVGWSADSAMSSDLGGREIVVVANNNSAQAITSLVTPITWSTVVRDTTASWDGSTFTTPETGDYQVEGFVYSGSISIGLYPYVDGVIGALLGYLGGAVGQITKFSGTVKLNKGELLTIRMDDNTTLVASAIHHITIIKLASPQTVLETETVAARYVTNAGQSIGAVTTVVYEDLDSDTHGAYNTGTGVYTVPTSGIYSVDASVLITNMAYTAGEVASLAIYIGATQKKTFRWTAETAMTLYKQLTVTDVALNLVKGDEITIRLSQNTGGSTALDTGIEWNTFSIHRIK